MSDVPFMPVPVHVEDRDGAPFRLAPGVRIVAGPDATAVSTAVLVGSRIGRMTGLQLAVVQEDDGRPGVVALEVVDGLEALGLDADLDPALAQEAYRLDVTTDRITVSALHGAGLLRGVVTLQQLARPGGENGTYDVAPVLVVDHPRYAWRGLAIDVARHFFGVETIKTLLTLMASLKLNVLHLHLTDDQGWRLEVPSRPALTEVSGATAVDGDPGGWYTAQEYAEIVNFAATRHIVVIPEIDVPGHVNAALHAYGELTPSGEPTRAYTGIDVGFSRLDASLPATGAFLHDVLGDVAAMTPGPFVHIGGDEVLTMESTEYADLVHRAMAEVTAAGKTVVAWQEVARVLVGAGRGAADGVVLQYWDEREGAEEMVRAARQGARVVLSPASKVYLDMRYDEDTPVGLHWAGYVEVRDSYEWEPEHVLPLGPGELLGVEAAIWSETIRTQDDLFYLLLPRLAAVAEVAWSAPGRRSWEDFARRVPAHTDRWREAGLSWYPSPQIGW